MKKFITVAILMAAVLLNAKAEEKSLKYAMGDIRSISQTSSESIYFEIHVTKGRSKTVEVRYDSEIENQIKDFEQYLKIEYISSEGILSIGMKKLPGQFSRLKLPLKARLVSIHLEMNDIEGIDIHGASSVDFNGEFTADNLDIDLSGAAKFGNVLNITGKTLSIDCSGATKVSVCGDFDEVSMDVRDAAKSNYSGNTKMLDADIRGAARAYIQTENREGDIDCSGGVLLELRGKGKTLNLEGSGACRIDARDYQAEEAVVRLSGACSATVSVDEKLRHDISKISRLTYYGTPDMTGMTDNKNVTKGM